MLIVHLITGLQYGGAETQLAQLVVNADKHRFRHVVVSLLEGGGIASELKAAGIEVISLGMKRSVPSALGVVRLIRLLRRLKPNILHCWLYHACLMGSVCGRMAGTSSVIWGLRSANPGLKQYRWLTRAVVRICAKLSPGVDCIVVNSEKSRVVHVEMGYAAEKMRTIQNGLDDRRFCANPEARREVREELGIASNALVVGMMAGYRPAKDHATFLRAARLIRKRHGDVRFLLAGEGISFDNAALAELIRENELKQSTHLLGTRRDVERVIAALDVACLSSWSESFPNAIAEAMACEVPCVVTDVGDSAHIVGDTGIVVAAQSPEALADGCCRLLELRAQGRKELGARARSRIEENFGVAKCGLAYENLYDEMVDVVGVQKTRRVPA